MRNVRNETISTMHVLLGKRQGCAERSMVDLCRLTAQHGHRVTAISTRETPLLNGALRQLNIPVATLDLTGFGRLLAPFRIADALKKFQAGILTVHDGDAATLCCLGGRLAAVPVITVLQTPAQNPHTDHIIAGSHAVRHHLLAHGVHAHRITLLRTGVDIDRFAPRDQAVARRDLGLNPAVFYFLVISRVVGPSAMPTVLTAFQQAAGAVPSARMLVVGAGPGDEEIREQIDRQELTHIVRCLGYSADIRRVLAASDCVVLPSDEDGAEQVLLEAMASSRATIAGTDSRAAEIIVDGDTGMLVTPDSLDALCMAFIFAARHPWWARNAGAAARQRVVAEFTVEQQYNAIERIYQRLAGFPTAPRVPASTK